MFTFIKRISVAAFIAAFAQMAMAAEFQVVVQGQLAKDIFSASFFGIADESVPVQISFVVNDAAVVRNNPGKPVILSSGASFNTNAYLVKKSDISNFVANIGNVSYAINDLFLQNLGTSPDQYDILLLGTLAEGGISGVQMTLANGSGDVQFGALVCTASCSVYNFGTGNSYIEGSYADIGNITVSAQSLTPPPSAGSLIDTLASKITKHKDIKALQKLAFLLELAVADGFLKKNKTVQAHNTMKAFIVTVKALVKAKALSAAVGNDLLAAAEDIIDAI